MQDLCFVHLRDNKWSRDRFLREDRVSGARHGPKQITVGSIDLVDAFSFLLESIFYLSLVAYFTI